MLMHSEGSQTCFALHALVTLHAIVAHFGYTVTVLFIYTCTYLVYINVTMQTELYTSCEET